MDNWIDNKLYEFFNESGNNYANMDIFVQIFNKLDNPEFQKANPDLYEHELKRIRDLHNTFVYAYEKGRKEGIKKKKKILSIEK